MALPPIIYLPGFKGYIDEDGKFVAISVAQAQECCCNAGDETCTVCGCTFRLSSTVMFESYDRTLSSGGAVINEVWVGPGTLIHDAASGGNCGIFGATISTRTKVSTSGGSVLSDTTGTVLVVVGVHCDGGVCTGWDYNVGGGGSGTFLAGNCGGANKDIVTTVPPGMSGPGGTTEDKKIITVDY